MDAEENVFLGIWSNWSRGGPVWAQTLTTTREQGNFLLTLTGAFISMVAVRLWIIVSLAVYRRYSDADADDPIHQQRQVILRNSSTPDAGFFSFCRLIWAWRRERRVFLRVLPALLCALVLSAGFAVAGAFSSKVSFSSDTGDDVLLKGNSCLLSGEEGIFDDAELQSRQLRRIIERVNDASSYAHECYTTGTSRNLACDGFATRTLPTAVHNTSAGCPFFNGVCMSDSNNLLLDSGFIRSDEHFGVNSPKHQTFAVRHVSQCAPLKTERFKRSYVEGDTTYVRYDYQDPSYNGTDESSVPGTLTVEDTVHQYASPAKTRMRGNGGANYGLSVLLWHMDHGELWWDDGRAAPSLHPDLFRTDGDLAIVSLSGNGVAFSNAANDDWYRPSIPINYTNSLFSTDSFYMPEEAASPLACLNQWQWCRSAEPGEGDCGPLGSWRDAMAGALEMINLTKEYRDGWYAEPPDEPGARLLFALSAMSRMFVSGVAMVVDDRDNALESQSTLLMGVQLPMPDAQWKRDVLDWWNTLNAYWQKIYIETALGSTDPVFRERIDQPPRNEYEWNLCRSQKIRSAKYTNFSVFGLCFIYVTGAVVTIISFSLESVYKTLHHRRQYKEEKYLAWTNDGSLQLHRLAHEGIGRGSWTNCTGEVPMTSPRDKLARLDITDREHPVLRRHSGGGGGNGTPAAQDPETPIDKDKVSPVESSAPSGASVGSGNSDTSQSTHGDVDSESDDSEAGTSGTSSPAVRISLDSTRLGAPFRISTETRKP